MRWILQACGAEVKGQPRVGYCGQPREARCTTPTPSTLGRSRALFCVHRPLVHHACMSLSPAHRATATRGRATAAPRAPRHAQRGEQR